MYPGEAWEYNWMKLKGNSDGGGITEKSQVVSGCFGAHCQRLDSELDDAVR